MPNRVHISELIALPYLNESQHGSEAHLAEHDVTMKEVHEACFAYNSDSAHWKKTKTGRRQLVAVGRTLGGRKLQVILRPQPHHPDCFYVYTAWEVS